MQQLSYLKDLDEFSVQSREVKRCRTSASALLNRTVCLCIQACSASEFLQLAIQQCCLCSPREVWMLSFVVPKQNPEQVQGETRSLVSGFVGSSESAWRWSELNSSTDLVCHATHVWQGTWAHHHLLYIWQASSSQLQRLLHLYGTITIGLQGDIKLLQVFSKILGLTCMHNTLSEVFTIEHTSASG